MLKINIYNTDGKEVGKMDLSSEVFEQEYNEALIHQVVVAQLNNKRQGTKSTLTRAEVRGGGIKPWKQKGTGRARQGSIRSPQWVKGGVVFAPKPRDFSQKVNKQMKAQALRSALSAKIADGDFIVLDKLALDNAKTKEMVKILKNFEYKNSALVVMAEDDASVLRASGNIPKVKVMNASLLNVYDLVSTSKVLITAEAIKKIEEVYA